MPKFTFENQGTSSFLVYSLQPQEKVDQVALDMLANNNIAHILPIAFTQKDMDVFLRYNISAKVNLNSYFMGTIQRVRLLNVFHSIVSAMLTIEDYMLDSRHFVLDPEYIFVDVSSGQAKLVFVPVQETLTSQEDMVVFFKDIMHNKQFDSNDNCDHVASIINFLNSNSFVLSDFANLLVQLKNVTAQVQQPSYQATHSPTVQRAGSGILPQQPSEPQNQSMMGQVAAPTAAPAMPTSTPPAIPVMPKKEGKKGGFGSLFGSKKAKPPTNAPAKPKKEKQKKEMRLTPPPPAADSGVRGFAIPGQAVAPPSATNPSAAKSNNEFFIPAPASNSNNSVVPPNQPINQHATPVQAQPLATAGVNTGANFGETTVLAGENQADTTVLGGPQPIVSQAKKQAEAPPPAEPKANPVLVREKTGEVITVNKELFRLGKEKTYVDYFVSDNSAVSRSHADISRGNGEWFIQDDNSTNHTYLDNKMINSNVQIPIEHGSVISLANERFKFEVR